MIVGGEEGTGGSAVGPGVTKPIPVGTPPSSQVATQAKIQL
jgi:hypothetical protein